MKTFIDHSHTVEHGMITYKGLPAPIICEFLSRETSKKHYADGTTFHIGKIEVVANTGTLIDLLGADIPIVEHMCHLENLPDSAFKFHAVPVKVLSFGTFPVRAYAVVKT